MAKLQHKPFDHPDEVRPYLDVVLESFGPGRLMIGSDWPVCLLAADYRTTMELVRDFIAALSNSERARD